MLTVLTPTSDLATAQAAHRTMGGIILTGPADLASVPENYHSFSSGYSGAAMFTHYQKGQSQKFLCDLEGHGLYWCRFETDEEFTARLRRRRLATEYQN